MAEPRRPIARFDREEFIQERFDYKRGEHLSIIGPTGNGKTYLGQQLLKATANEKLPAVMFAMKPKDSTIDEFLKKAKAEGYDYRKVSSWPPAPSPWKPGKPDGWVIQPKHTFDVDRDEPQHAEIFYKALLDSYKKGNRILFGDEAYSLCEELGLKRYMITLWTKGRSMGAGMWAATQKPTHVPLWMYSQASHLFLSYDPDKRARDRYREISGIDPDVIQHALNSLEEEFSWVYIRPEGRRSQICIVGA
ncbi:MAG TPA: hypothetical protein VN375_19195 [Vicinamibacteria bacterium]|nr:hypothetical protein [Vicinamibacteria bacterium]